MPSRLRLYDIRMSTLPQSLGLCDGDVPQICDYVNGAQRRLMFAKEIGDEGWVGTYAEVVFSNVSKAEPYITCSREIARIEAIDVCRRPVHVNNQFMEYLEFGNGRMPKLFRQIHNHCQVQAYSRNNAVLFADLDTPPKLLRFYSSNANDYGAQRRVLVQGPDQNNMTVYSLDGYNQVQGEFVTLDSPFAQTVNQYNWVTGLQKDITLGQVQIFQVDPVTGVEEQISSMEPGETVAGYRRYYLNNLPNDCYTLSATAQTIQVRAIVKLEPIPVRVDTDYLVIGNLEALSEECQSIRYETMDNKDSHQMADRKHNRAIRLLIGECTHYYGKDSPSIIFKPFGSARLEKIHIGMR